MAFKMKNPSLMKMAKEAGSAMKLKKEPMKMKEPMKLKKDSPMDLNEGFDSLPKDVQSKILKKDSSNKLKKEPMKMKKDGAMKLNYKK